MINHPEWSIPISMISLVPSQPQHQAGLLIGLRILSDNENRGQKTPNAESPGQRRQTEKGPPYMELLSYMALLSKS
jgi:hypothetical protein